MAGIMTTDATRQLTEKQYDRVTREARRTAKEWHADSIKTNRPITAERAARIAAQEASYCDHIARGKHDAMAGIFYRHLMNGANQ